ncbi:glycosyltransferase [Malikia spinosa]|uniref:Glycosyltransferase n=1 Tax=Malikia spinosa TaxID=86180 RepID=A0A7C9N3I5_9BURK|nr:glycosyltransferase [Malikia spinosa]MYZ53000.1 glycosyltransferase [Malikia spinosa]
MHHISFIIVAYNSIEHITDCIQSIISNIDPATSFNIIVVDNSDYSLAETSQKLVQNKFKNDIIYKITGSNLGYGTGNNIGADISRSQLICIVNPDVRLTQPLCARAFNRFESCDHLAMLGFSQVGGSNISFYFYPHIFFPFIGKFLLFGMNFFKKYHSRFFFPSGALIVLDRAKFLEAGGFDEKFFLYCEDADLSKRLVDLGYKVDIDFSISYSHLIDSTARRKRSSTSKKIERESLTYYMKKHQHSLKWLDFKVALDSLFLRK